MSVSLERLDRAALSELGVTVRNAGIAGAGGAGFPTHAKWERVDEVDALLVNHQESEPNYYMDRWLGREHAEEFAQLFDALLEEALERVVVGAKITDREWLHDLEIATDATVYRPADLPVAEDETGVVVAYTERSYQMGMESVLMDTVAGVVIGQDLPMDHGWIVQNTETMYQLFRTLEAGEPVTRKLLHVDGAVPNHRFLDVPVGTPAADLLEAAGRDPTLNADETLLDGGPGWCFAVDTDPDEFGVRKRTNCVLVANADVVGDNTLGNGRVNLLETDDWKAGDHGTEPISLEPDRVRIPLISNPDFEGVVARSRPIVEIGEEVEAGEMIATPANDGISNAQHASIGGEIVDVTETHVAIERVDRAAGGVQEPARDAEIYWTWCTECGDYVAMPHPDDVTSETRYVCEDCE